jgi:molybdopterin/thiamine biosynthesis adenylyltransferase
VSGVERSVVMEGALARALHAHLIRADGQEDLCFALWRPSTGRRRTSAMLVRPILPRHGERRVHGNASFLPTYFERAIGEAIADGAGLAFLHSHPGPGWQDMSPDDVVAEQGHAAATFGATGLPLVGLTTGSDGTWSGRFWEREGPRQYGRRWCRNVRTVDQQLSVDFADALAPPPAATPELERTLHAWGARAQGRLARLRVGVVGVGSVGAIVAEALARTGLQHVVLIDFDRVETRNLDRLLHATRADARTRRLKVDVAGDALDQHAAANPFCAERVPLGIHEVPGYEAALDCDALFSGVDRPWPRHILNLIAYAHAIPVVDGGIFVRRSAKANLIGADWRAHTVGPQRRCLACIGQYDPGLVEADRQGLLDDPKYIEALPDDHPLRVKENVFAFSAACASALVLQLLQSVVAPSGCASPGRQLYHFVPGILDTEVDPVGCDAACAIGRVLAQGDAIRPLLALHEVAAVPTPKDRLAAGFAWLRRWVGFLKRSA